MRSNALRGQFKDGRYLFFTAKDSTDTVPASKSFELPTFEEIVNETEACRAATARRIITNERPDATGVHRRYLR